MTSWQRGLACPPDLRQCRGGCWNGKKALLRREAWKVTIRQDRGGAPRYPTGVQGEHNLCHCPILMASFGRIQRMEGTADVATTGVEQWQLARRAGRQER